MRKEIPLIAIPLLAGIGLWMGFRGSMLSEAGAAAAAMDRSEKGDPNGNSEDPQAIRTKASDRDFPLSAPTHRPERLKDFMLPEVVIDGLELDAALRKLQAAYQDACRKTGETPLELGFAVPPGSSRKLHLRLSSKSFKSSVHLLANLSGMKVSGMKVSRDGLLYRFEPIENEGGPVKRTLDVPPDFQSLLSELNYNPGARIAIPGLIITHRAGTSRLPTRDLISRLGLELDPSTRLTLGPSGELAVETDRPADAAALAALVRTLVDQPPFQLKFKTKVIELAPDAKWTPPDLAQMDESQLQMFMREMAQQQGTELITLPSVTTRNGQSSTIEITREFITPTDETAKTFETHNIGKVMHVRGSALGFGHDLDFDYNDTTGDIDTATMKPVINKRTDVKDAGFSSDGGTRFVVQTRPDGSKAIVLLTSELIDATGRPLHGTANP